MVRLLSHSDRYPGTKSVKEESMSRKISRRELIRYAGMTCAAAVVAACSAPPPPAAAPAATQAPAAPAASAATAAPAPTAAPASADKVVLDWYLQMLSADAEPDYRKVADLVTAAHPNVTVKIENVTGQDSFAQLQTRFAAGNPPDLFLANSGTYANFAAKGVLAPLDDALAGEPTMNKDKFWPAGLDIGTFANQMVAVPYSLLPAAELINKDILKAKNIPVPQKGWKYSKEFVDVGKASTNDQKGESKTWGWAMQGETRPYSMLMDWGAELINAEGTKSMLSSDSVKAVYHFIWDLTHKYNMTPAKGVENWPAWGEWKAGRAAMQTVYPWALSSIQADTKYDWVLVPVPTETAKEGEVWTNVQCMPKATKYPKEAFYLLTAAVYNCWKIRNEMPSIKTDTDGWLTSMPGKGLDAFIDNASLPATWLQTVSQHPKTDEIQRIVQETILDRVILAETKEADVDGFITEADGELNQALSRTN
jgi:multiple sugar transport system substrate-binding protein